MVNEVQNCVACSMPLKPGLACKRRRAGDDSAENLDVLPVRCSSRYAASAH
jgi:hypothetical protein